MCVHEHLLRSRPSYAKTCVYERDKGVCTQCGMDTKIIAKGVINDKMRLPEGYPVHRRVYARKWGGGLWDMDHIVPVHQGGGLCGLENLQTLCIPCHKSKSYKRNK